MAGGSLLTPPRRRRMMAARTTDQQGGLDDGQNMTFEEFMEKMYGGEKPEKLSQKT